MTPKQKWIFIFMKILCRKCGRCERIFDRLQNEIGENEFDIEMDRKANIIVSEEA
jgi:hypothetical protein